MTVCLCREIEQTVILNNKFSFELYMISKRLIVVCVRMCVCVCACVCVDGTKGPTEEQRKSDICARLLDFSYQPRT